MCHSFDSEASVNHELVKLRSLSVPNFCLNFAFIFVNILNCDFVLNIYYTVAKIIVRISINEIADKVKDNGFNIGVRAVKLTGESFVINSQS